MLFATYRFLMKFQVQHHSDTQDQQREPTLGQIFLAGAGCGLASTYIPSFLTKKKEKWLFSPQTAHDADRTHQDSATKAATTPQRHPRNRVPEAHFPRPRIYVCARRRATHLPCRWHPYALPRALRDHLARRRRIWTILLWGASCVYLPKLLEPKQKLPV